ncbi:hypothetical protein ROZALSC1DRAFT_31299, partial [Rozella allomycis CSF55]
MLKERVVFISLVLAFSILLSIFLVEYSEDQGGLEYATLANEPQTMNHFEVIEIKPQDKWKKRLENPIIINRASSEYSEFWKKQEKLDFGSILRLDFTKMDRDTVKSKIEDIMFDNIRRTFGDPGQYRMVEGDDYLVTSDGASKHIQFVDAFSLEKFPDMYAVIYSIIIRVDKTKVPKLMVFDPPLFARNVALHVLTQGVFISEILINGVFVNNNYRKNGYRISNHYHQLRVRKFPLAQFRGDRDSSKAGTIVRKYPNYYIDIYKNDAEDILSAGNKYFSDVHLSYSVALGNVHFGTTIGNG